MIHYLEKASFETYQGNATVFGYYVSDPSRFGVVEFAKKIKPSSRGELEITDINQMYLQQGSLLVECFNKDYHWIDTGTMESLKKAGEQIYQEQVKGYLIGYLEKIAFENGWINFEQLYDVAKSMDKSPYGQELLKINPDTWGTTRMRKR